jgi:hypothetical protein
VPLGKGSAGMPSFSSIAAIRCDSRVLRRDVSERTGAGQRRIEEFAG